MAREPIGYLLWDVTRRISKLYQEDRSYSNLTLVQAKTLTHIHHHQGIRQVELAELLDITPMTLVRTLDSLMDQGFVERRPDPTDRRAYQLFLTDTAKPQLAQIMAINNEVWQKVLQGLSDEEIGQFMRTLHHMHHNLA